MKIAIIGKICSGKTTTADILIGLNNDFQKLSFAGKVKSIAVDLFDMEKDRKLLQQIGTYMREIDPDVWANYVVKQSKKYDYVVIDDLRYKNEYDLLKKMDLK